MTARETIEKGFWCERVRICFSLFIKDPMKLQHLLLFGPPGSGKTTSASWLVDQIWGAKKSLMCISMNAADERSLESIRQKVYPFIRVDWRQGERERAPRFLILDECETLTEAAQLSLQTILNSSPRDICVILICNSQSRIHPKLRQRLLRIRYDPPNRGQAATCIQEITRGDLRLLRNEASIENRFQSYIHEHPSRLLNIIRDDTVDYNIIQSDILLLADIFNVLDMELLHSINRIYPLTGDSFIGADTIEREIITLIQLFRQKFEAICE